MRTFLFISGYTNPDMLRHYVASGYATPQQLLDDLDAAKKLVSELLGKQPSASLDIDAFLDQINKEKGKQ